MASPKASKPDLTTPVRKKSKRDLREPYRDPYTFYRAQNNWNYEKSDANLPK